MERFIRRQNIEHYRQLLEQTTDATRRQKLLGLLAEEMHKAIDVAARPLPEPKPPNHILSPIASKPNRLRR
jgi:hypothetical protein